ncbi:hypothetical protein [Aliiroseovarius subalbicans]|uniref:hypothetical protein n=1 Tax=Aliiroseovarius subalbicans TaxID=2925840 RepID=UPI001F57526C|nr:hypothetical protein [Aliiroseovarius subalbicans]MCI2399244.1 hypothetical protein [Aliiroseovarius subalbicans]
MTVSLLEKARAGRLMALESLNMRHEKPSADIFKFELDFIEKPQQPIIHFKSRRIETQEVRLAA